MSQREENNRKILQGAKQEKMKLDTKITHMNHEIRKLQIDNEKLRQSLRTKLDMKVSAAKLKTLPASETNDEFSIMIRDGFVEQMQEVNRETLKAQQLIAILSQWLSKNFSVRITAQMSPEDVKSQMEGIVLRQNTLNESNLSATLRKLSAASELSRIEATGANAVETELRLEDDSGIDEKEEDKNSDEDESSI